MLFECFTRYIVWKDRALKEVIDGDVGKYFKIVRVCNNYDKMNFIEEVEIITSIFIL